MTDIKKKLDILYDLLVDNPEALKTELQELIVQPDQIDDSNKFASLLVELNNPVYIDSLLKKISVASKGAPWLCDFLYATTNLLDEGSENDEFVCPDGLLSKLEEWILNSIGELSWKAAGLLKFYDSDLAEQIQLKKLEGRDDFFLTYVECVDGLVRFHEEKYKGLIKQIAADETRDTKLREYCDELIQSLSPGAKP